MTTSPRRLLPGLALFAGLLLAGAPAAAQGALPQTVTREWLMRERLVREGHRFDDFDALRTRPGFVQTLMDVAGDATQPHLIRANAALMLGATGDPAAVAFLERFLDGLPPGAPLRLSTLYALGSPPAPTPGTLQRLTAALERGTDDESMVAARSLARIGSSEARGALTARRRSEGRASVRARIDAMLRLYPPRQP